LDGQTPVEAQYGHLPDVSWFRPFGCRVTVFRGRDEVGHHKLAPRGEACTDDLCRSRLLLWTQGLALLVT
jgi:hypothetical protein